MAKTELYRYIAGLWIALPDLSITSKMIAQGERTTLHRRLQMRPLKMQEHLFIVTFYLPVAREGASAAFTVVKITP